MGHSLVQEFITNDYQASVQAVLDQALRGTETENFEFPLITKAGAHIEVLLNATTRRDEQGNIIGKMFTNLSCSCYNIFFALSTMCLTHEVHLSYPRRGGHWAGYYCSSGPREGILQAN